MARKFSLYQVWVEIPRQCGEAKGQNYLFTVLAQSAEGAIDKLRASPPEGYGSQFEWKGVRFSAERVSDIQLKGSWRS